MKIQTFGYTDIGDRPENEDSVACEPIDSFVFATVCDGLGGHGGGKAASSIAVKWLSTCVQKRDLPSPDELKACLTDANEEIYRVRTNSYQMKSTVTFMCVKNNRAMWAHIGDSRIYHFHNGVLKDFTNDHSVPQINVMMGKITRDQIPDSPDRNKVLRVLGSEELSPEIHETIILPPGQHAFLLCSDGLWEYLKDNEIWADLNKSETPAEWIYYLRCRKEQRKIPGEEADNNSAVAVFVDI